MREIGPHLPKLLTNISWHTFLRHSVVHWLLNLAVKQTNACRLSTLTMACKIYENEKLSIFVQCLVTSQKQYKTTHIVSVEYESQIRFLHGIYEMVVHVTL